MDGSIPTTADAALEQAFDAAIERGKKEDSAFGVFADDPATPNLGRMLGARLSTADPQAFPQPREFNTVNVQLLDLNCNLKDKRDRRERLQKVILDAQEELRRVNKVIAAVELAIEKLAE